MTNLLTNPTFAAGTYPFREEWGAVYDNVQIPNGWSFWYRGRTPTDPPDGFWACPEINILTEQRPEHPAPPLLNIFTRSRTTCYSLGTDFPTTPGKRYRFSVHLLQWSSNLIAWRRDDAANPGSYWNRLGLDPLAHRDCHAATVIWSHGQAGVDRANNPQDYAPWHKANCQESFLQVETEATGPKMSALIMGFHEFRMTNGVCLYWNASCEEIGAIPPGDDVQAQLAALAAELSEMRAQIARLGSVQAFGQRFAVWNE